MREEEERISRKTGQSIDGKKMGEEGERIS